MKILAFSLLLSFLMMPLMAQAQTIDPRAQILKSQIEGFLESQKAMAVKNNCLLTTKGDIVVEKSNDGYYAFTLPHITYTDAKGIKSEIGMIALNAAPQGNNNWGISFALPTPILSYDKTGAQLFKTNIGGQTATGVWNERLGHFTSVDANLSNITFADIITQKTITVGALKFLSQLDEQDQDAFTGKASAVLETVGYVDSKTGLNASLPKVSLTTNLADRASKTVMTKDDIKNRPLSAHPDFYNIFAQLFGAPERVDAVITGLDGLSAALSTSMLSAKPEARATYLSGILGVGAVAALGKTDPKNPSLKYYDVEFGQNGEVFLNGTDFGSLMTAKK